MIDSIGDNGALAALGLTVPRANETEDAGRLGQEEFLKLMLTQLRNQDPTKPLESGEFLGQLAQFGTVSGLGDLKSSFEQLASSLVSNQALQAASLVGRNVLARSTQAELVDGEDVTGAIELPQSSSDVRVQILDSAGQLVRELALGPQSSGLVRFSWSGDTDSGQTADEGRYRIAAQFLGAGQMQSAGTLVQSVVESVSLNPTGLGIQLRGLGQVAFSSIAEIG